MMQGIGTIYNYYGSLFVEEKEGTYFWWMDDWQDPIIEEIPEYLFKALIKFEKNRKKSEVK